MAASPARQGQAAQDVAGDELLRHSLVQLVAYFTRQMQDAETMRNQLIFLANAFGAKPKDLGAASDLTTARVYQVIKDAKETNLGAQQEELASQAAQLLGIRGNR